MIVCDATNTPLSVLQVQSALGLQAAPDEAIDLAETGLRLAALDRPESPLEPFREHLGALASDLAAEAGRVDANRPAALLADILAGQYGYAGDAETYDDPQNADLMRVIDRRRGLPVALGILYIQTARAQGWAAEGVNFPAHFLVRVDAGGQRAIIDPFDCGRVLDTAALRELLKRVTGSHSELKPEFFAPLTDRGILQRLLNNVKSRALRDRDLPRALSSIERMVAIEPESAELWHQYGVLSAHLGNLATARDALESCIARSTDERMKREAASALDRLRRTLN